MAEETTDAEVAARPPREAVYELPKDSPEIELDLNVAHGATAAKFRQGSLAGAATPEEVAKLLRVSGQVRVSPQADPAIAEGPKEGLRAPGFRAVSFDGKMIDLSALRGKKIWLVFYRYATCPLCNLHLSKVFARSAAIKKAGLEFVAVFESPVPQFFQPGKAESAPFAVISDPQKKLYSLYDTRSSLLGLFRPTVAAVFAQSLVSGFKQGKVEGDPGQLPSHFLIDEKGIIRKAHHGTTAVDHLPWSSVGLFAGIRATELKA